MGTSAAALPGACRQHVDKINSVLAAGNYEQAFTFAYEYFRARVKYLEGSRRADADGFRREGAHLLAAVAGEISRSFPADEFRFGSPLIGGGNHPPEGEPVRVAMSLTVLLHGRHPGVPERRDR